MTPGLGYCGLDRSRRPLRGDEIRGCWTGVVPAAPDATTPARPATQPAARLRGFVPLESFPGPDAPVGASAAAGPSAGVAPLSDQLPPAALAPPADRVTLFDLDA